MRWVILAALFGNVCFICCRAIIAGGAGFPLDDGWIHQTYARNLARTGRWEYGPWHCQCRLDGAASGPIWLALGYFLRLPYFFLGFSSPERSASPGSGSSAHASGRRLWPAEAARGWQIGLLVVLIWPLIWAAGSGMETLLFIALGLQAILAYYRVGASRWGAIRVGLLAGVMILVRPDGLPLLLLLAVALLVGNVELSRGQQLRNALVAIGAAALPLVPYFLFNRWAQRAMVAQHLLRQNSQNMRHSLAEPLWQRFLRLLYFSLGGPEVGWRGISGAHLLLLPGLIAAGLNGLRADLSQRRFHYTVPLLWAGGHVLLYAWRLAGYLPTWSLSDGGAAGLDVVWRSGLATPAGPIAGQAERHVATCHSAGLHRHGPGFLPVGVDRLS